MKSTNYMKGLLYAEEERQRLERNKLSKKEIDIYLLGIYNFEQREYLYNNDWLQGFDDYRNAYLKGEIV